MALSLRLLCSPGQKERETGRGGSAGDSRRLQGLPAGRHVLNGLTHKSILLVFVSFNIYLKPGIHFGAPFQAECKHTIE